MTGYHIHIGYNSGYGPAVKLWPTLKEAALSICDTPERIASNAVMVEGHSRTDVDPFAEAYRRRSDLTITFKETGEDATSPQIMILASGGGPTRELKEACARAFIRLLIRSGMMFQVVPQWKIVFKFDDISGASEYKIHANGMAEAVAWAMKISHGIRNPVGLEVKCLDVPGGQPDTL